MIPREVFLNFPEIHTDRLVLRKPGIEDVQDIFEIKSDPLVTVPYCAEPYSKIEQADKWIRELFSFYSAGEGVMWFITKRGESKVIGDCTFWHIDSDSSCGELGYELGSSYWNNGIATEATTAVIKYGFGGMNLNRIEACPFSTNKRSARLLEKIGFTLEGNLRQRVMFRNEYFDQLYYSILKGEFSGIS
jgi:ribosomal-protein-alanine N-acetyltransferase